MSGYIYLFLTYYLLVVCLTSCHSSAALLEQNVQKDTPISEAIGQNQAQTELLKVFESSKPLGWIGVKKVSELAHESQVIGVFFDHQSGASLSGRLDAENKSNKTKQSQEFEIDRPSNLTPSTSGPQETTGTTPPIGLPLVALTSTSVATTSSSAPEKPSSVSEATQAPTAITSALPSGGGWPAGTTEPAPAGSKVDREGAAVLCGEANANGKSNKELNRIVGGSKTEPGEFPFQVRLNIRSRRGSGICGGVILDQFHILTAAHCMTACVSQHLTTATIEASGVKATVGDHSIKSEDGEEELDVETITPHEKYDACNFYANDHDIAMIKVATPIKYKFTTDGYGSVNRPCMPESRDVVYKEGEPVIVSGWGVARENSGALSNILRYVQVPIVNVSRCQETYGSRVTQDHVCAGLQAGGKDSCQGDSGGPLVRVVENRYELVGIVSFGYGCGQPGAPGVYTRVASYIDWIKANKV